MGYAGRVIVILCHCLTAQRNHVGRSLFGSGDPLCRFQRPSLVHLLRNPNGSKILNKRWTSLSLFGLSDRRASGGGLDDAEQVCYPGYVGASGTG